MISGVVEVVEINVFQKSIDSIYISQNIYLKFTYEFLSSR